MWSRHGSCVIELNLRRYQGSFTVSLCSPVWLKPWVTAMSKCAPAPECLSLSLSVLMCGNIIIWLEDGNDVCVPSFPTDPEPWGKHYWWLPGCPVRWERLLGYSVPPLVSLHHWQWHQRGPPDRSHREPSPALLHGFSSLWHTVFPSASTSGVSATAEWKNTICFHRSW